MRHYCHIQAANSRAPHTEGSFNANFKERPDSSSSIRAVCPPRINSIPSAFHRQQRDAISRYAQQHNMEIVRTYNDAAKSGLTIASRPALRQLIDSGSLTGPDEASAPSQELATQDYSGGWQTLQGV